MKRNKVWGLALVITLMVITGPSLAANQKGVLEITGVPQDVAAGRYDPDAGVFYADVSELPEAQIRVEFEDVRISGKEMEWRTKDNYLLFRQSARLEREDFELWANQVEYFGEEERLAASGSVIVVTEDATIHSEQLTYDEKTDEALFTGEVLVIFNDGELRGEKFLMLMEKSELRFFGTFHGEFEIDSN